MDDQLDYYARNKQARREYQRKYYRANKERIRRRRRLEELHDPQRFQDRKDYNRKYYQKNRAKILKKRALAYAKRRDGAKS
jgi:hypothetical protein